MARAYDGAMTLLAGSPFRIAIEGFRAGDPTQRAAAEQALRSITKPYWEAPTPVDEGIALEVLEAAFGLASSKDAGALVFPLIGSAHPSLLAMIAARFAAVEEPLRLALLTVVASSPTRAAAALFATLVGQQGWPTRTYPRLFTELGQHARHGDLLFPAILDAAGVPVLDAGNLLLIALRGGGLDPAQVAGSAFVSGLAARIDALAATAAAPTDDEMPRLALALDLAGFVGGDDVVAALDRALTVPVSWPAAFAVASSLRRGRPVDDEVIARVAGDHATRATLYALLREQGPAAVARMPAATRTRDAFAAADMVGWLAHPGELGQPPDRLEQMAIFGAKRGAADVVLYVWRFQLGDAPWKASVSGPYSANPPEGPIHGNSTFSRFEAWDAQSAEAHAGAILDTLDAWAADRAARARPAPWRVDYADGAANAYRVWQDSAETDVLLEYVPVTPERSSSGTYSGGPPRAGRFAPRDLRIDELWGRIDALAAEATAAGAAAAGPRTKGTGAFTVTTPSGGRTFIVATGEPLEELDKFLATLGGALIA